MLANACKCAQMFANAYKCMQMLVNACKCLQTLANDMNTCDCNPIIHKKCFNSWKKISNSCPICRKDFIKDVIYINEYESRVEFEYNFIFTYTIILASIILLVDMFFIGKFFYCIMCYKMMA